MVTNHCSSDIFDQNCSGPRAENGFPRPIALVKFKCWEIQSNKEKEEIPRHIELASSIFIWD